MACLVNSITLAGLSPPKPAFAEAIAAGEGALRNMAFLEVLPKDLAVEEEEDIVIERDVGKKRVIPQG